MKLLSSRIKLLSFKISGTSFGNNNYPLRTSVTVTIIIYTNYSNEVLVITLLKLFHLVIYSKQKYCFGQPYVDRKKMCFSLLYTTETLIVGN